MTRRGARASRGRARPWPLPLGRCAGRVGSGTRRSGPGRSGGALLLRCRPPCPMGVTGVTSIYRGGERGLVSPPVFKTGAPRRLGGRVRFPSASAIGGVTSTFAAEGPRLLSGNDLECNACYSFATHPFGMGSKLLQMTKPPGVSRGLQCSV